MDEQLDEHGGGDDPTGGGSDQPEGPHVPRDDFVSRLVPDPAQPPQTLLLTGFVGDSSEEGHVRIYFDPELSQYVDVPTHAVLHSEPLPREESALGGSHVWVRADAQLRQGQAGGQEGGQAGGDPNAAGFLQGQLMTEHLGAAGGGFEAQNHTLATVCTQLGCFTQQICVTQQFCITQQLNCRSVLLPCAHTTVPLQCLKSVQIIQCSGICPTRVKAICEPIPRSPFCNQPWTPITRTPVLGGGGQVFGAAGGGGGVSAQCQMSYGPCPTHLIGCTGYEGCGQPPIGHTGWQGCGQEGGAGAEAFGAEAAGPIGPTGWLGCQPTAATICTQIGCPTKLIGCTGWLGCGVTRPLGCPNTRTCPPTRRPGCGCLPWTVGPVSVVCPSKICPTPTFNCPDPFGGGGGFGAEAAGGGGVSAQCQMSYGPCGPIGHTGWQGCGQTDAMGCPDTSTCPPHPIGQTGWQGCGQEGGAGAAGFGAEAAGGAGGPIGPTGWQGCVRPTALLGCRTRIPVVCTAPGPICPRPTTRPPCTLTQPHICTVATLCCHRPTLRPPCTFPPVCPTGFVCGAGGVGGGGGFGAEAAGGQGPVGPTGWQGCGVTDALGCPDTSTCPPQPVGPTGWYGCTQPMGCPNTSTCPPHGGGGGGFGAEAGGPVGPTGWQGCGQQPIGQTGWQGCGEHPIGQTGWLGCTMHPGCGCLPWTVGPVIPTQHMEICGGGGGGAW